MYFVMKGTEIMDPELYSPNRKAYDAACALPKETGKAAVIHPTGTGNSFIAFQFCAGRPQRKVRRLLPPVTSSGHRRKASRPQATGCRRTFSS